MRRLVTTSAIAALLAPGVLPATLLSIAWVPINAIAATQGLGDLSAFKKIVADTQALVDKGDLPGATVRIKDLEVAWDEAEAGLKPRDAASWHRVDKAIDRALDALRSKSPNSDTVKKSLAEVATEMDKPTGK